MPDLRAAQLYVRAALPRLGSRPATAPDVVLHRAGVRPRPADVAAYCDVVGQAHGDRLPLLYPHLFGFGLHLELMTGASFPFPAMGLVHIANVVTATRPLPLDGSYDVEVQAGDVGPHPRGRVVDLLTTVRHDGEPVWHETSTYLRRERPPADRVEGSATVGGSDDGLHFSARWRLPAQLGRQYARVSGDVNPIHLSAWTARPLGFPRAIAHGMWTAAAVVGALDGRLPDAVRYAVEFRRPITLPGTVRLFTRVAGPHIVAEVRGRDDDTRVHLTSQAHPL